MSQNATSIPTNKLQLNLNFKQDYDREELGVSAEPAVPSLWGVPLKYVSWVVWVVCRAA
jgi:solute carrier family 35 (UDP-sugar transporter), member A1/2/3